MRFSNGIFMVENTIKILDKVHLQKYVYLLFLFTSEQMDASAFESLFLQIRREDHYWLNGLFNERIEKILDTFFLDIDEYVPIDLYDPNDKFNINEEELRKRSKETLTTLKNILDNK